jgi:multisubunit Na+/H+ antiporter MnhG subunit
MPLWIRAAGIGSSIIVLIALAIAFFKQLIAFIGFLTFAIKILIVLVFIALIAGVGMMVLRAWKKKTRGSETV